jgi:thiol:disulfide interchange protein DsbD
MNALAALTLLRLASMTPGVEGTSAVASVTSAAPGSTIWVALRIDLEEGYHVYYQNPGDTGFGTTVNWTTTKGTTASPTQYAFPKRITDATSVSIGYEESAYFATKITIPKDFKGKSLSVTGESRFLVCKNDCVPGNASIKVTIPIGKTTANPAWAKTAGNNLWPSGEVVQASAKRKGNEIWLEVNSSVQGTVDFVPSEDAYYLGKLGKVVYAEGGYTIPVYLKEERAKDPKRLKGLLFLQNPGSKPKVLLIDTPIN